MKSHSNAMGRDFIAPIKDVTTFFSLVIGLMRDVNAMKSLSFAMGRDFIARIKDVTTPFSLVIGLMRDVSAMTSLSFAMGSVLGPRERAKRASEEGPAPLEFARHPSVGDWGLRVG